MESKGYDELRKFGIRHYYYINQIFGDLTLREIITEEFESPGGWTLETMVTGRDFEHSFHHYCTRYNKNETWCSVLEGIQNIRDIHPHDTLCQSYSVMKYMGTISDTDTELTEELQKRMVEMWRMILNNRKISEQIVHASKQYKNYRELQGLARAKGIAASGKTSAIVARLKREGIDPYLIQNISPKERSGELIAKIRQVLDDWEAWGWQWFMIKKE
jgi:hypothetical protein